MARLIGCFLIGGTFLLLGMRKKAELIKRCKALSDLECSLLMLENEIGAVASPLPHAMRTSGMGSAKAFFESAAGMIEEYGAIKGFTDSVNQSGYEKAEKEVLCGMGAGLGAADSEGQLKNMRLCRNRISAILSAAAEECDKLGKLYVSSGAALGVATIILLI